MQTMRRVKIAGTGMYVPPQVVTNDDLTKLMDTSDEWIQQRTGIKERHYTEDGVGPTHLALEASKHALERAGLTAEDLDAILVPSLSPHFEFPGISAFLQDMLGVSEIPTMDIRCQCMGFLYAFHVGQLFVASGQYDRVLICGAEVHSGSLDFTTRGRDVAVIFGDGAGALILEPSDDERGILSVHVHAQGEHAKKLWVELPGTTYKPRIQEWMVDDPRLYPQMDGRFVFKHAVTRLPEVIHEALNVNKCAVEDVDFWIFHQANLRINEYVGGQLGIPPEKTWNNIDRYGNCSAASIPMCLDEASRAGRIQEGDLVCLAGFGSGFTWGSALLRW